MKQETTTITRKLDDEDDEGSEGNWSEAPLFATSAQKLKRIQTVAIHRSDPDSGYLGWMPPDVSEATLMAKWGGGTYKLEAKNALGQVVPGGRTTLKLAGDPIFNSQVEERRYRRANGLAERDEGAEKLSTKDLLQLIEEKDEKRRAEQLEREDRARGEAAAREERERTARDERAAQAQKDADERKARETKEADEREERRRREAREDDERRSRIHREDMERLTSQNAQQLANTQQFFAQMATTLKADAAAHPPAPADSGGAVMKALLTGIQVAREIAGAAGGGGDKDGPPPDALTSLIQRLPETLREVRQTGAAVMSEITGKKTAAIGPAGKRRPVDHLTITGPTATKAKRVLNALAAAGKNPEAEMDQLLDFAAAQLGATAAPAPPAAPSSAVDRTTQRRARGRVRTKQARPPARRAAARRRKGAA